MKHAPDPRTLNVCSHTFLRRPTLLPRGLRTPACAVLAMADAKSMSLEEIDAQDAVNLDALGAHARGVGVHVAANARFRAPDTALAQRIAQATSRRCVPPSSGRLSQARAG